MRRSRNAESLVDNAPPDTITRSKLNFKIESNAGFSFNRSTFEVESSQSISRPEISSVKPSAVKKKRGRPRKYGSVSVLPLAPPHERSKRGRPPKAASLGRLVNTEPSAYMEENECSSRQQTQSMTASLLNMIRDFDETADSNSMVMADDMKVEVGRYTVNSSLSKTLEAIMSKYGDIAKDCQLESNYMQTCILEGICRIVQKLEFLSFTHLKNDHLKSYYSTVEDALKMGLNVRWLHQRLEEIDLTVYSVKNLQFLREARREKTQMMDSIKISLAPKKAEIVKLQSEMEKLRVEIQELEDQLEVATLESEELTSAISDIMSKCRRFHHKSLIDELI